jgi:hypothetical protein
MADGAARVVGSGLTRDRSSEGAAPIAIRAPATRRRGSQIGRGRMRRSCRENINRRARGPCTASRNSSSCSSARGTPRRGTSPGSRCSSCAPGAGRCCDWSPAPSKPGWYRSCRRRSGRPSPCRPGPPRSGPEKERAPSRRAPWEQVEGPGLARRSERPRDLWQAERSERSQLVHRDGPVDRPGAARETDRRRTGPQPPSPEGPGQPTVAASTHSSAERNWSRF